MYSTFNRKIYCAVKAPPWKKKKKANNGGKLEQHIHAEHYPTISTILFSTATSNQWWWIPLRRRSRVSAVRRLLKRDSLQWSGTSRPICFYQPRIATSYQDSRHAGCSRALRSRSHSSNCRSHTSAGSRWNWYCCPLLLEMPAQKCEQPELS